MQKLTKKDIAKLAEKGIKITISNDGLVKEKINKGKNTDEKNETH